MSPRRACRGPSKLQGQADHLKMINSIVLERCQNRLPVFSSRRDVLTNGKARPSKQFQKSSWAPQIPSQGPPGARASPLAKMVFSSFGRPSKVPGPTGPVKLINSTVLSRCQNRLPKSEPKVPEGIACVQFFSGFRAPRTQSGARGKANLGRVRRGQGQTCKPQPLSRRLTRQGSPYEHFPIARTK